MLDYLFSAIQALCAVGYLYGAYLCIRHAEAFTSAPVPAQEETLVLTPSLGRASLPATALSARAA